MHLGQECGRGGTGRDFGRDIQLQELPIGSVRISRYPEDRVEQEYLRHYCAGRLERNSNSKAEMIFVDL
jgi:hypothetical protein